MRYRVTFSKSTDVIVEAESAEALNDALGGLGERDIDDLSAAVGDTWDVGAHATHDNFEPDYIVHGGELRAPKAVRP